MNQTFQKIVGGVLAVTALMGLSACGSKTEDTKADGKTYKVGIVQFVDDASLNQIEEAIEAELDAKVIVSESETLQPARQRSSEIIRRAESRSKELYHVANTYTEDALRRTEEAIQMALDEVKESRVRFRAASQEQMQAQKEQINQKPSALEQSAEETDASTE